MVHARRHATLLAAALKEQPWNGTRIFHARGRQQAAWRAIPLSIWDSRNGTRGGPSRKIESNLSAALNAYKMQWLRLRQVHSDVIHRVNQGAGKNFRAVTRSSRNTPGLLLTIQTADCVPVLLADKRRHAVAAIHAGWRGTWRASSQRHWVECDGVRHKPADVLAALGPAIGQCSFEVGPEVAQLRHAILRGASVVRGQI